MQTGPELGYPRECRNIAAEGLLMRNRPVALVFTAALIAASAPRVEAADLAVRPLPPQRAVVVDAKVPLCTDPSVLAEVEDQFDYGAEHMLKSSVQIVEFSGLFEKAYFPALEDSPIERRYCQGQATLSGGDHRTLYYVIEYPLGFASLGWKAQGCVLGYDRWHIYGANCESLRRF